MKLKPYIYAVLLICLTLMSACGGATPVPTPTAIPSATTPATWTFDHPQRIYSLRFQAGWRQEVISHGKGYE